MQTHSVVRHILQPWVKYSCHSPIITLLLILTISAGSGWVVYNQFRIDSKLTDIIVQDTQWRRDFDEFKATYPELIDTAIVVISGSSAIQTRRVARQLTTQFSRRNDYFSDVFSAASDDFFYHNALLYQPLDELYDTADQLALAQPFLTRIAERPSVANLLDLITDSLDLELGEQPPEGLKKIVRALQQSSHELLSSKQTNPQLLPWIERIENSDKTHYQLISLKGKPDYRQELPHSTTIERINSIVDATNIPQSVTIRLTGEVALAHEEISAAKKGVKLAGVLSLLALGILIYFGIRSMAIAAIALLFILIGTLWTTALGLLLVGYFNTLSLLFMVMFFGLAIDFLLHFSLRYEEATYQWIDQHQGNYLPKSLRFKALLVSTNSVGSALLLCALTTSISFLSFSLTDYRGLAELGIISAGGMLVALLLTFTLLPVIYLLLPIQNSIHNPKIASFQRIVNFLARRHRVFIGIILLLCLGSVLLIPQINLQGSVLALRDKQSESVSTLAELQQNGIITDYSLFMFKQPPSAELVKQLEALDSIDTVIWLHSYIPSAIDEKLYILEDLQLLLESALQPQANSNGELSNLEAVSLLNSGIEQFPQQDIELQKSLNALGNNLNQLIQRQQLAYWNQQIIAPVLEQLDWLNQAVNASEISVENLPKTLTNRLTSVDSNGVPVVLSTIIPADTIIEDQPMRAFIDEVKQLVPTATGRPVIEIGIADLVKKAFVKAVLIALLGIALVLLINYRSFINAIWILIPLGLTTLFTLASMTLLDISFNLANILVIPLIFGLSIDNGIHVIDRYNHRHDIDSLVQSSTPRAVLLSSLTTLCSFASLSLSPHVGTATIGLLLTIAILIMFIVTVIILPVIIKIANRQQSHSDRLT